MASGGSRISQTGAPTPKGMPSYYFGQFSPKLHKNEKKNGPRGGVLIPGAPLGSANDNDINL